MGLDSFKSRIKDRFKKLRDPDLCPECGSSDTERVNYYMRCNADGCEVSTYVPNEHRVSRKLL